jgi:hypothetical protein
MKPIRSTDYFAFIPSIAHAGLSGSSQQSRAATFPMPALLAASKAISDKAFHQRVLADLSLLALMAATTIFVVIAALSWSH